MRTSLNTLITADTGIRIFESHVLVPQETDLSYNMFRTLLYTLPTSHTSTWIHGYILSCYSFHLYLLFLPAKLCDSGEKGDRENEVRLGLFKVSFPKQGRTNARCLGEQTREVGVIVYAETAGDFLHGKVGVDEQPFGLQHHFVLYIQGGVHAGDTFHHFV